MHHPNGQRHTLVLQFPWLICYTQNKELVLLVLNLHPLVNTSSMLSLAATNFSTSFPNAVYKFRISSAAPVSILFVWSSNLAMWSKKGRWSLLLFSSAVHLGMHSPLILGQLEYRLLSSLSLVHSDNLPCWSCTCSPGIGRFAEAYSILPLGMCYTLHQ